MFFNRLRLFENSIILLTPRKIQKIKAGATICSHYWFSRLRNGASLSQRGESNIAPNVARAAHVVKDAKLSFSLGKFFGKDGSSIAI